VWLLSLAFGGMFVSGVTSRIMVRLVVATVGTGTGMYSVLFLLSGLVSLVSWITLVWGLSSVLVEFRRRMPAKPDGAEDLL
jgi:hypothetical protein